MISLIPRLLAKPETQQIGQQIVGNLAQRLAARLIRDVLLRDETVKAPQPILVDRPVLVAGR